VILESDDWGSIRTPKGAVDAFHQFNIDLSRAPYHQYDTLESPNDIEHTYELLESLEKKINKKVRLTLNYVMCNPDFDQIKASNYQQYYPEDFRTTYSRYWGG